MSEKVNFRIIEGPHDEEELYEKFKGYYTNPSYTAAEVYKLTCLSSLKRQRFLKRLRDEGIYRNRSAGNEISVVTPDGVYKKSCYSYISKLVEE